MSKEETPDDSIGDHLLLRVVKDMANSKTTIFFHPPLPDIQPLHNEPSKKLFEQLAMSIKVIGNQLNHELILNKQIEDLARLGDKTIFLKLVEGVFNDGQISWGRIIVLFYAVGKLAVKMLLDNLPLVFSDILNCCLDFIRGKLLSWIRSVGGWINSISALTQFSVEHSSFVPSFYSIPSSKFVVAFVCGIVLGSTIVWKCNKSI